jgi:hypothetical protein
MPSSGKNLNLYRRVKRQPGLKIGRLVTAALGRDFASLVAADANAETGNFTGDNPPAFRVTSSASKATKPRYQSTHHAQ